MFQRTPNPLSVLVVDDEKSIADSLTQIFRLHGHEACSAYSGERALDALSAFQPQVMIADVLMDGMDGVQLAVKVAELLPDCAIVLFSGQADLTDTITGPGLVSDRFKVYAKPVQPQMLVNFLEAEGERRAQRARRVVIMNTMPEDSEPRDILHATRNRERRPRPAR